MKVDLIDIRAVNELTDSVKSLYLTAFPPEERRPWDNIESMLVDGSQPYKIYVINCKATIIITKKVLKVTKEIKWNHKN